MPSYRGHHTGAGHKLTPHCCHCCCWTELQQWPQPVSAGDPQVHDLLTSVDCITSRQRLVQSEQIDIVGLPRPVGPLAIDSAEGSVVPREGLQKQWHDQQQQTKKAILNKLPQPRTTTSRLAGPAQQQVTCHEQYAGTE
jgi:hypothetical protein